MGYAIKYRSTRRVSPNKADAIDQAASILRAGRTWLSCEPPGFSRDQDGHALGFSKPNITPDPYDAAAAAREGLPDGTTRDLLDILCQLSREHGIDWEISDGIIDGPVGYIRKGVADAKVDGLMDLFAELPGDILRDLEADAEAGPGREEIMDDEDDAEPPILPFRPRGE